MIGMYALCWLNERVYWLLVNARGVILARSLSGFASEAEALSDFRMRY